MADEVVVKEPLTEEMKKAGEHLTRRLGAAGFDVVASFWLYTTETSDWRLMIASPTVEAEGPRAAYEAVLDVLENEDEQIRSVLGLHNITVLGPTNSLVRAFRSAIRDEDTPGVRFRRSRVEDLFVEDAYVYKVA